ncbi:MAG TPA: cation:proton antiporter [Candidatus Mailhella merdigallinarum]|uniref:Cation:proton antiporter n=1 Tax=Candidatus Mailhella merdigallinarum TaxID=2838658 RepID=A0A9D2HG04_9BACT|nr:cation:proton antiporter [Candidatus Mailhella merdigallinarum]
MPHDLDIILTLTGGLTAALVLGFITQKMRLSPLVGYLVAGICVGPHVPGFVADPSTASQYAEIGIILLMFGVGLHFHLKDLLAVQRVALPGAAVQIATSVFLGAAVTHLFGWDWKAGALFGMAISVASTVVLTRVLTDNRALHTPTGHVALGWLVVEDLFTILALVLLPPLLDTGHADGGTSVWAALGVTLLKLGVLAGFTLVVGQRLIPWLLGFVARTGTRDLFTLAVLVLALGIAVGSAEFFGASMALGAFLGGMVVGQSDFSARAASEALPLRDAFAVLFFVSVGMLFDPSALLQTWPLALATLGLILVGKPAAALLVVLLLRRPLSQALGVAVALAQIGEFSFILAALGADYGVLPPEATNAIIAAAIVSITLNPLLYPRIPAILNRLRRHGLGLRPLAPLEGENSAPEVPLDRQRAIVAGYGPTGRVLCRILRDNAIDVVVVEMNIDTVRALREAGEQVIHGDVAQAEVLVHAGLADADALIISSPSISARDVLRAARDVHPGIRMLAHTASLREARTLRAEEAVAVFSGEGEVALTMSMYLMRVFGATEEQMVREGRRIRAELDGPSPETAERTGL